MRKKIMKKTTQKITAIIIIMIICNFIMSTKVFADYGAASQDPGASSGNAASTGQNTGTIMDAVTAGLSPNIIKEKIKSQLNVSDDVANKIYTNCYNDSTKITVSYTYVSTTGLVTLNSVSTSGVSQEDINKMTDGSYVANGGSQTATAGGTALGTDGETASSGSYNQKVSEQEGADEGNDFGVLFGPLANLIQGIGDSINKILQTFIIGDKSPVFYNSGFFSSDNVQEVVSENPPVSGLPEVTVVKDYIDTWSGKYGVPDIKLTPAEIFAGKVSAFDANFFKTSADHSKELGGEEKSIVEKLGDTVSTWYVALRNIAIVGLLSALLYIGIRIIISSSNAEKAKYKQFFVDWVVALCLIFFLHYIMAFTMTMSETVTDVLAGQGNTDKKDSNGRIKQVNIKLVGRDGETQFSDSALTSFNVYFSSNFTGVARIKADYKGSALRMGYSILYLALTVYTAYFSFVYIKRLLMLAFFTMIAPLVALTYPLDKIKDGKSQAFDYWFREYMFYALLQPLHMLLYTIFVSSALEIASNNLLYSIVVMAFIVPAEKIVKEMFGIKGKTESAIGGFAGGAIASQAFSALKKGPPGPPKKGEKGNATNNDIRMSKGHGANKGDMSAFADDAEKIEAGATGAALGAAGAQALDGQVDERNEENDSNEAIPQDTSQNGENGANGGLEAETNAEFDSGANGELDSGNGNGTENEIDSGTSEGQLGAFDSGDIRLKDRIDLAKEGAKARRKELWNNTKTAANMRYVAAGGWKGMLKTGAKTAAKAYVTAFETTGLAATGLALGMVGPNMSDTVKGMTAGIATGAATSRRTIGAINNAGKGPVSSFTKDVTHGFGEDREREESIRNYMNNNVNRQRLINANPNIKLDALNNQLRTEAIMSYDTGFTDHDDIQAAIDMENVYNAGNSSGIQDGSNHARAVQIALLEKQLGRDTFVDQKKYDNEHNNIQKGVVASMNEHSRKRIEAQHLSAEETAKQLREARAQNQAKASKEADRMLADVRTMKHRKNII